MFHVKHFCSTGGRILFHVKHGIVACEANGICADAARARHGDVAQLVGLDITDDTSELQLSVIFAVGCDVLGTPLLSELHHLHRRGGHWPSTQREDIT